MDVGSGSTPTIGARSETLFVNRLLLQSVHPAERRGVATSLSAA